MLQLVAAGIEIEDIDTWIESVRLPRGHTKLKKKFFASRIVHNEKAHIKAFANEVLTAVMCLGFFIDAVLKPGLAELGLQHLQDHLDCFDLLRTILRLLSNGGRNINPKIHAHLSALSCDVRKIVSDMQETKAACRDACGNVLVYLESVIELLGARATSQASKINYGILLQ